MYHAHMPVHQLQELQATNNTFNRLKLWACQ